uniref:transducin-like enhancer protein 6 n=1 Tax=Callospermophilus lateralis TaxID=76772 RepID=UPI004038F462
MGREEAPRRGWGCTTSLSARKRHDERALRWRTPVNGRHARILTPYAPLKAVLRDPSLPAAPRSPPFRPAGPRGLSRAGGSLSDSPVHGPSGAANRRRSAQPTLQLRVSTQLESIFHLLTEVQQDLQEHHRQVEAFLQTVEASSPALDGQPLEVGRLSPGKRTGQGHQEALSPSCPQLPEGGSPQESDFEDVVTRRQSDWLRPPQSSWDEGEMPPCWDPEPPFWQDVLTTQLWQIFADVREKAAQPCQQVTEQAWGLGTRRDQRVVSQPLGVCSPAPLGRPPGRGRPPPPAMDGPPRGLGIPGARLSSPMSHGQDSKGLEPPDTETAASTDPMGSGQEALAAVQGACPSRCARCAVPSLWLAPTQAKSPLSPLEDCREEAALAGLAQAGARNLGPEDEQEPDVGPGAAGSRGQLGRSWDPADSGDSWRRPDTPPRQCRRFALPHTLQRMRLLRHGEPVLALAVSSFTRHAFTCSRDSVKVWSLVGQAAEDRFPDSHLPMHKQAPDAYLCTCLLTSNSRTLLTGGHNLGSVCVWDLVAPSLRVKGELPCREAACQALAARADESLVFAGFTDGSVRIWDLRAPHMVRDIIGRLNGARSIVVKDNDIWTGGLDGQLCKWDLRILRDPTVFLFKSQIMSLSLRPQEDWLLLGLANGQHWLQHCSRNQARRVGGKDSAVLGLKFSPYGQWWVSVGMDNLVGVHSMPTGALVFQVPEASCVLCCDVSADNRLVVVGSGTQASVYLVTY